MLFYTQIKGTHPDDIDEEEHTMKRYVVYDSEGKCGGYFLPNEEHLAKLYAETHGGRYEVKYDSTEEYEIVTVRSMDNEVRYMIYSHEENAFFGGYDFMGSVNWVRSYPSPECELTEEDDPEQIVEDLIG